MIVSWEWLEQYTALGMSLEALTDRLTMTGLNVEGTQPAGDDTAIDLEVTSNRPDCLGHIGVAREISVLFRQELTVPEAVPVSAAEAVDSLTAVQIECRDLCPQYIARVVRGVRVGPSPQWLQDRLTTLGIASVNNVVDITNFVLMECGQPLHAFDLGKLSERRIVVRRARAGEKIVAIDQKEYELSSETCVIADAQRPVAIGGVMGGLDSEIGESTHDVLIETAAFDQLSVRHAARQLNLHSPSSYRFERGVDRVQMDWASRRCCQLILEIAGGELLEGRVLAGDEPDFDPPVIDLRWSQIRRILGIDVPPDEAQQILASMGLVEQAGDDTRSRWQAPSWRRDLEREIDLIEEVARIHGYDRIPDTAALDVVPTSMSLRDRLTQRIRSVLTAQGCFEAVTLSFVSEDRARQFTPRGEIDVLRVDHSHHRRENVLRQSLVPSLLDCRRENEKHGTADARLFEIAKVYLEARPDRPESEVEPWMISCVTGQSFRELKGVIETLVTAVNPALQMTAEPFELDAFVPGRGARLLLDGQPWGWLGEVDRTLADALHLKEAVSVFEVELSLLESDAQLISRFEPLAQFPAISRDMNFVLDESVSWGSLESTVRGAAGPLLDAVRYAGQYRGKQIADGKKSYLLTVDYRAADRTLTADQVDLAQQAVVAACVETLGAELR